MVMPGKPVGASAETLAARIDIGRPSRAFPVTPPCVRVAYTAVRLVKRLSAQATRRRALAAGRVINVSAPVPQPLGFTLTSRAGLACTSFCRYPSISHSASAPLQPFGPSQRGDTPLTGTMASADFCLALRGPHDPLSPSSGTRDRSPGVSSTAFSAQPPDLRFAPLMDMAFAVNRPLRRYSRLLSGFCPSARAFATRFLQTPPHDDALALH